jgi:hypothetical protein
MKRMAMSGLMEENPKPTKEVADDMLKSIGARVLEMFNSGKEKFLDMDEKYARAVDRATVGQNDAFGGMTRGASIRDILAPGQADSQAEKIALLAMEMGAMGTNVASRYALPAGAAMLGAKGVADITGGLYDAASEQPIF